MKALFAVLGVVLLAGCGSSASDCPRKDKSCGKGIVQVSEPNKIAQEEPVTLESAASSK